MTYDKGYQKCGAIMHCGADDVSRNDAKTHAMEHQNTLLRAELHAIESRSAELGRAATRSPEIHLKHQSSILKTIESVQQQIERVRYEQMRTQSKTKALQTYMDLIIKINGELSDTLINREQTRAEILRLSGKIAPPHYTWPKEIPYTNILDVINEAATATTNSALRQNTLDASIQAARTIVRALSPGKSQSRSRSAGTGRTVEVVDSERDSQEWLYKKRRPRSASARASTSPYADKLDKFISSIKHTTGDVGGIYERTRYRKGERGPDKSAAVRRAQLESAAALNMQFLSHHQESLDRSAISTLGRRPATRPASVRHSGSGNTSSFRSANASRSSTANTRAIARQGAITYATRFAAAATAAATAAKVANTPSPLHSRESPSLSQSYRSRSVAWGGDEGVGASRSDPMHVRRTAAALNPSAPSKASFIPSGNQKSEFNVVASVSKAARAAQQLNATLASKVKSLQFGGTGDLFDEVPRVSLMDMQQHLAAVKKLID
ncbi:hypothetical protein B484DRAFT_399826 [Ochromonadaceae sp. CCMP2298]|nr:hypothetical protein B484DRAFT_399826 [Ochromonadaceae sp. CCMP2298]